MSMVVFSGLKCQKCGTRVAVAVTPHGKSFPCPTCQAPMRARRRVTMATALAWCPHCWTAPQQPRTTRCPKCGQRLEPMYLALAPTAARTVEG